MEEQETLNAEVTQAEDSALQKHFNTVTPFSKSVALILFIALPVVGLLVGYELGTNSAMTDLAATQSTNTEEIMEQDFNDSEPTPEVSVFEEDTESMNIGEYINPDEPAPQPQIVDVVADGETFYFRYYGEVPGEFCTSERRYLDCISSMGLTSGYKLPAEFDPSLEDSLFVDFCNFGYQVNEKVDNIYCGGQYSEVIVPRQVSELGNVQAQTVRNKYDCTFELESLSLERAGSEYVVLSGEVLNPECRI